MKKMNKLTAILLSLGCLCAVGGFAACNEQSNGGDNSSVQTEISFESKAITLKVGDVHTMKTVVSGEGEVSYVSSDPSVVSVDAQGKLTAVKEGVATITATVDGKTATCRVRVCAMEITGVSIRESNVRVVIGATQELHASCVPTNATNKNVEWSSSDEEIATVDANGVVKGIAEGEATLTVKTVDGGKTATCLVKVGKPVASIQLDKESVSLIERESVSLKAILSPEDAVLQDVVWESSNKKVASVADGEVYAVSAGEAVITATSVDGNKKATCTVSVAPFVELEGVELVKEKMNVALKGTVALSLGYTPENPTNKEVVWESSNREILTVDKDGVITPRSEGTATVKVSSVKDDKISDSVEITVIGNRYTFKNQYYTPTGDLTFTVPEVSALKLGEQTLTAGTDYTYENGVVSLKKSVVAASSETALTFVSNTAGDATVEVKALTAAATNFDEGDLGTEIFTGDNILSSSVEDGLAVFDMAAGKIANVALNEEYLDAMFAYPYLEQIDINLECVENISGNIGIRLVKPDGSWYNDVKSKNTDISMTLSRVAYEKMKADVKNGVEGADTVFARNINFVWLGGSVGANAKIKIDYVQPYYNSTTISDKSNKIYADMPTDSKMNIELSSPATALTLLQIGGQKWYITDTDASGTMIAAPYAMNGNVVALTQGAACVRLEGNWPNTAATLSVYRNEANVRLWLRSAYSNEVFGLTTAKTPAASQTFAAGGSFALSRPTSAINYEVMEATVDGVALADVAGVSVETDEKGATAVKFENAGSYRLQMRVKKTVVVSNFQWVSFDMYDRIITVN